MGVSVGGCGSGAVGRGGGSERRSGERATLRGREGEATRGGDCMARAARACSRSARFVRRSTASSRARQSAAHPSGSLAADAATARALAGLGLSLSTSLAPPPVASELTPRAMSGGERERSVCGTRRSGTPRAATPRGGWGGWRWAGLRWAGLGFGDDGVRRLGGEGGWGGEKQGGV